MLLEDKVAVVYGGGGDIGGAVAREFAREGAWVFLVGRTEAPLDTVAEAIRAGGGRAETATLDVMDEEAVTRHADDVASTAGRIDVAFNAVSHADVHGVPLLDMAYEDFARPVVTALRAQFLVSRAVARHMVPRRSGVLLSITASTARRIIPEVGGTGVAFDTIESLCRQWAGELGPHGIRVVWLHTTGIVDAIDRTATQPAYGTGRPMSYEELVAWMEAGTMLGRLTTLQDVATTAAFLVSDRAAAMTAASANITLGSVPSR